MAEEYASFSDPEDTTFELYEELNPTDEPRHGSVKSSFSPLDEGGLLYYQDDPSTFTTSVERILCVDGFEDSTEKKLMTLLVLKIVVASGPEEKVCSVAATVELTDPKGGREKSHPDVVAWAPFKDMNRSNETEAQVSKKLTVSAEVGGEAAGVNAKIGAGYEYGLSWTQKYYDEGYAHPIMSRINGKRNGVRWVLKANPMQVSGVPPELMIGVLFTRDSDAPYLLKFDIRVKGGSQRDWFKKVLGLVPENSKPYLITPSKDPVTRYEGEYMLQRVTSENLGRQRAKGDPTNLRLFWMQPEPQTTDKGAEGGDGVPAGM